MKRTKNIWLGSEAVQAKLILFMWVDAAINKFAVILGPALAAGIIAEERARGTLDLLTAKPIRAGSYFTTKVLAAMVAFTTFYVAACLAALLSFPWRIAGFDASDFAALSAIHLLAGLFAVAFSATMAVYFKRRLTGMLVSVTVLGTLVGVAFLGFYYPAYRTVSYLNPFFDGIVLIGSIDDYRASDLLFPILLLVAFNFATVMIGRHRAVHVLEEG